MRAGLDIGGTKVEAVAVDDAGDVVERITLASRPGPGGVLRTATTAMGRLSILTGVPVAGFDSAGVGIPGVVDQASGRVEFAVNLGVERLELGVKLSDRLGIPVRVENDVRAAALGAQHLLDLHDLHDLHDTMAYLNVGSGMAAAVVAGGRLWTGSSGIASEIGHLPIDVDGARCGCGQRGCIETVASGFGVARQWRTGDALPVRSLFDAADAGDTEARRIRGDLARGIASAVRVLVLTVDAGTVVIGGGVTLIGDPLLDDVRAVLAQWGGESAFLERVDLPGRVRLLPHGLPVAAVGAALVGRPREDASAPAQRPTAIPAA